MSEQAQKEEILNVFDMVDKLSEKEIQAIVDVMELASGERVAALMELKDPRSVGVYYAVYGRYMAEKQPYTPDSDALADIVGTKLSIMADALEDGLSGAYIWGLDSALLTDITQLTLRERFAREKAEEPEQEYPH